ncbi:MAG: hypothetical protein FJZ90_19535, partial [Chloroflexi bacterium]|nr:hypothetical protein [Chloroflexota bacterium]
AAMVGLMGNLEGVLELIRARGWGSESLWRWLDIKNMPPPAASSSWYPDDAWWWWRASRVIHDRDPMGQSVEVIDEFPFFSFLLGDNHPHVLALPFVFLALALALNVLLSQRKASAPSGGGSAGSDVAEGLLPRLADYLQGLWQGGTWEIATWGLLLGAFLFLNTWDYLIYLGVFVLCFAAHRYRAREGDWLSDAIGLLILLLLIAVVLYLPFLLSFRSQAGGLGWVGTYKTRLHQYLLMMGVFIYLLLGFLAASASHWVRGQSGAVKRNVVSQVAGAAFAALALVSATQGWWTAALVLLLAGAAGGLCLLALAQPEQSGRGEASSSPGAVFALLLVFVGLMLTGFVEFLFLKDTFGTRMNTVFKFYYQAWVLLAIASVYGLQLVWRRARSGTAASKSIAGVWAAGGGLLVLAGLLYTAAAIPSKANGFRGTPTLDGTRYVQEHRPDDYGAIQWLRQHAPEDAVMLEATGGSYSEFNWVSAHTGIPTLLGWGGHQLQWRGNYDVAGQREPDIAAIYQGMDARATLALLDEYGIDYVYLGR